MTTFLPEVEAGSAKFFRYHPIPCEKKPPSFSPSGGGLRAPSMLQSWGTSSNRQEVSSKAGCAARGSSPRWKRQLASKGMISRGPDTCAATAGVVNGKPSSRLSLRACSNDADGARLFMTREDSRAEPNQRKSHPGVRDSRSWRKVEPEDRMAATDVSQSSIGRGLPPMNASCQQPCVPPAAHGKCCCRWPEASGCSKRGMRTPLRASWRMRRPGQPGDPRQTRGAGMSPPA